MPDILKLVQSITSTNRIYIYLNILHAKGVLKDNIPIYDARFLMLLSKNFTIFAIIYKSTIYKFSYPCF